MASAFGTALFAAGVDEILQARLSERAWYDGASVR
jgi:hypothetical protein